ncbi:MAG TPA: tRNA (adenine-N1)-methyltransferase [Synergistaceae bacterium]|nr:tRNA (adenine-N1)-methyltransferase [Synergistaceae bacterium]HPJ25834.1 tRNA (adenine-N1)-methyltransferase [Synergistaceae bacterium]HPQ37533.1 tRNA (adenine-N1)-methyltransferase [Synergistaceae bacterium]
MIAYGELVFIWSPQKGDSYIITLREKGKQGTHLGEVLHDDIAQKSFGDAVYTHLGKPFFLFRPTLGEYVRRIKRKTQIIYPKDGAYILLNLNIFPGATVVECGTGSGGLTTILAQFVGPQGKVFTYDKREDFSERARQNVLRWGVGDRVVFSTLDLDEGGFDQQGVDAVFLDLPNPWDYLDYAKEALAPGGRLGILVPTFNQIEAVLRKLREKKFLDVQVEELFLRSLKTNPNRIRPEDQMVGHTGYLIFSSSVSEDAYDRIPIEEDPQKEDSGDREDGVVE